LNILHHKQLRHRQDFVNVPLKFQTTKAVTDQIL